MKKKLIGIGLGILALGGIAFGGYKNLIDPTRGAVETMQESMQLNDTLSIDEAKEDLAYLMDTLATFHPAWLTKDEGLIERVELQYKKEIERLKEEMTLLEFWKAASRVIHEMYDAHSRVSLSRLEGEERYKFTGEEIVSINGQPIESIYETFLGVWPYELESYAKTRFDKFMVYEEYLELFGVDTSKGIEVVYRTNEGERIEHLEAEVYSSPSKEQIYYEIDETNDLGILTIRECKNNKEHFRVIEAFFKEVQEKGIQNIAVDVRENNGGWMAVAKAFMKQIDRDEYVYCNDFKVRTGPFWYSEEEVIKNEKVDNPYRGKIYVLTSPKTFSAAMDFAMIIKDNGIGELVGETCGNPPDSYTYNQKYQLPNSKLKLAVSSTKQSRIDETKIGELLVPDYEVPSEEALAKVYELIK